MIILMLQELLPVMMACENDIIIIPEKYKKMSLAELETEKEEVLKDLLSGARPKKTIKENKNNICFRF